MGKPLSQTCRRGHPWTVENTAWFVNVSGIRWRQCRTCKADRKRAVAHIVHLPQVRGPGRCVSGRHAVTARNTGVTNTGRACCLECAALMTQTMQSVGSPEATPAWSDLADDSVWDRGVGWAAEPDSTPVPRCGYLGQMLGPWGGPGAALEKG